MCTATVVADRFYNTIHLYSTISGLTKVCAPVYCSNANIYVCVQPQNNNMTVQLVKAKFIFHKYNCSKEIVCTS